MRGAVAPQTRIVRLLRYVGGSRLAFVFAQVGEQLGQPAAVFGRVGLAQEPFDVVDNGGRDADGPGCSLLDRATAGGPRKSVVAWRQTFDSHGVLLCE